MSSSAEAYQSALASYCRTGILGDIPGIHPQRVTQYRRMVYNVVDDILRNAFPLTEALFSDVEWDDAVHNFISHHPCLSPQVWSMPREFYEYLSRSTHPLLLKYPFLKDLLALEWTELELFMREDQAVEYTDLGDILFSRLVLNPDHELLAFQYPVHRESANKISLADKGDYYVIAHRNQDGNVLFAECSILLARMIELLREAPQSLKVLFETVESEFSLHLNEGDQRAVVEFFSTALQQELIAGFKK